MRTTKQSSGKTTGPEDDGPVNERVQFLRDRMFRAIARAEESWNRPAQAPATLTNTDADPEAGR